MAESKKKIKLKNFINGSFKDPINGDYIDNYNPAIGELYGTTPNSDEDDVNLAVKAAEMAFPAWAKMPIENRSRILTRIADLIEQNLDILASAETDDTGKPLSLAAEVDIPRSAANFRFFANAISLFASEAHPMADAINYTLRKPLGVVGCISPWNLPLYLFTWKIAPALAAGNCVVAKPSEVTPRTAFLLSKICDEAGLPKGVLNVVHGLGQTTGKAIVEHPNVKAISFTGGTETGRAIAAIAAPMFKKLSLELGGKNPNIVFADADLDKAISTTVLSSFRNQGQICLCGSRVYVQNSVYERFKTEFMAKTYMQKVGDPRDPDTSIGSVVSEAHMNKILYHIDLAKDEGGKVVLGGNQVKLKGRCENGWFIHPTIIEGLPIDCRTNQEEIFGPVVTIQPFEAEEEVLALANGTQFGLSASIWTNDIKRATRMANKIDAGIVWINTWMKRDLRTPFGGMKQSGVGREGGLEALRFFTEPKNVCIQY
ncbi:UNVERIFIED_CONTAM: hypothetical protein GTU68_066762 [Idotea baltica]|nr:hypothetical protein [Idotea baltica]